MNIKMGKVLSSILLLVSSNVFATAYNSPPPSEALIGQIQYMSTNYGDTATTIAAQYDLALMQYKVQIHISLWVEHFPPGCRTIAIATSFTEPTTSRYHC